MRERRARSSSRVYLAVGLAGAGLYLLLQPELQTWAYRVFPAAAVAATILRSGRDPSLRTAWVLLGVGYGLMGLGDVLYQAAGDDATFPSVADAAYAASYMAVCAGAFLIGRWGRSRDLALTLEAVTVALAAGLIIWVLWVDEVALSLGASAGQQLLALAYPVLDLVIITLLAGNSAVRLGPALRTQAFGWSLFLIADVWYARAALEGTYEVGVGAGALWMAGYVLFGAATFLSASPPEGVPGSGALRRVALSGALLTAPVALIVQATFGTHVDAVEIGLVGLLLSALVLWRLLIAQRESRAALQDRERALMRERSRARAAWQLLDVKDPKAVETTALEALSQILPSDVSPRVACWRVEGHKATVTSATGEGADRLLGSTAPVLEVRSFLSRDRGTAENCSTIQPVYFDGEIRMLITVDAATMLEVATVDAMQALTMNVELALANLALTRDLTTSEASFRSLADASRDVVFRYRVQHPRGFDYVSPSIERFTGFSPDDHYADLDVAQRYVHPDDWPRAAAIYSGRIVEDTSMNIRLMKPDGTVVETEHHVCPVFDDEGKLVSIHGVARDVTSQKAELEELRASESVYREAFVQARTGKAIVDGHTGLIVHANPALSEMTGYPMSELAQLDLDSIFGDEDGGVISSLRREAVEFGRAVGADHPYRTKDGEEGWAHMVLSRLDRQDEKPILVLVQIFDVTREHATNARLIESEALLRAAFDEAGVAMAVGTSVDRPLERVNRKLCEMTGFTPEEFLAAGPIIAMFPDDRATVEGTIAALSWEDSPSADVRFVTRSGELRWARLMLSRVERGDAEPGIVAQIVDVTAEKEATEAAERGEEMFRRAFDDSDMPMALTSPDLRFLEVNDAMCRYLGYERAELLSLGPLDIIHPEDVDPTVVEAALKGDLAPDRPTRRYLRKDGSVVWASVVVSAVRDAKGDVAFYLGQMRDLTHEQQTSARVKKLEKRSELLLAHAGQGICGLDKHGGITFINPAGAKMLGWSVEELVGREIHPIIHHSLPDGSPYPPEECPILRLLVDGGAPVRRDTEVYWKKDGTSFPVSYVATPIADDNEELGVVLMFEDITSRTRLEDQLRQAQKMEALGAVAGGVAHDFNNLLFVVRTAAQFMLDSSRLDADARRDAEDIVAASERGADLVGQLLTFSRKEVGHPLLVDLGSTLTEMEKMIGRVISENIALTIEPQPNLWMTMIDPVHAEQVLLNLAVNARDAMPEGGRLVIRTANMRVDEHLGEIYGLQPGPYISLIVSDTGVGIPDAIKGRIFEPFFTTKAREKGTGLGLSTVYGIVTKAGGTVIVDSTVGVGSTFRVYLPAVPSAVREQDEAPDVALIRGRGQKILIVEDDPDVRKVVVRVLRQGGYSPLAAGDATEALEFYANNPDISLVLTDVVMPGMSGFSLAEELGHRDEQLPILYMSGYAEQLPSEATIADRDFIQKPFSKEELLAKVGAKLASKRVERND